MAGPCVATLKELVLESDGRKKESASSSSVVVDAYGPVGLVMGDTPSCDLVADDVGTNKLGSGCHPLSEEELSDAWS